MWAVRFLTIVDLSRFIPASTGEPFAAVARALSDLSGPENSP
jgi:hypothetical protein